MGEEGDEPLQSYTPGIVFSGPYQNHRSLIFHNLHLSTYMGSSFGLLD